ncbi:MAG: hypothetical protein K1W33_02250 [Clostridia bacterium]
MKYLKFLCMNEDGIEIPDDIEKFIYDTFEIYEIRALGWIHNLYTKQTRMSASFKSN